MPIMLDLVKAKLGSAFILLICMVGLNCRACIWDARTLWTEKHEHPTLADAILHPKTDKPDVKGLTADIQKLKANPQTNDPMWWNNLAGSYLRLGQPVEAVKILEPVTNRFADDYGIHANLGTAYHLLGRYRDAEREIRRDTEINTNAHFGLEKYHLALLQYLSRDEAYRFRHLYVDEFTWRFLIGQVRWVKPSRLVGSSEKLSESERKQMESWAASLAQKQSNGISSEVYRQDIQALLPLARCDEEPGYLAKWDLGTDPKLEEGVIYMATLNPREPACWTMLGTVAWRKKAYHLAINAYQKAIQLDSQQTPVLKKRIAAIQEYIDGSRSVALLIFGPIALVIAYYIFCKVREFRAKRD